MGYINLDPLYKLLCLVIIFLVPLLPAYSLYKIAPSDKFFSSGNFSGFKINATGASAIYIVLFAALYSQTNTVIKNIDSSSALIRKIQELQNNKPWKVEYRLKLMDNDGLHEISPTEYAKYVDPDSIICSPRAMHFDIDSKTITFYIDDKLMADMGDTISSQLFLRNGYGTTFLNITKNLEDPKKRLIAVKGTFYKLQSKPSQLHDLNSHVIHPIEKSQSNAAPPVISVANISK